MPGLLAAIDVTFEGGGVTASLQGQVEGLDTIVAAVQGLLDGPPDLADLPGLIGRLPLPPALSGLGTLPGVLAGLADGVDLGDVEGLLAPLLAPLLEIGGVGGGGFGRPQN